MALRNPLTTQMLALLWGVLLPLGGLAGCGGDDTDPKVYADFGVKKDAFIWPDFLPRADFPQLKLDGQQTQQDGGTEPQPDGGSEECAAPTDADCGGSCAAEETCTPAEGGTCATTAFVTGKASETEALLSLAKALAACWDVHSDDMALCSTLDTCGMENDMVESMNRTWVCEQAQVSDFTSAAEYESAQTAWGCGGLSIQRIEWQIGALNPDKKGEVCLTYEPSSIWYDTVYVHNCADYPPS